MRQHEYHTTIFSLRGLCHSGTLKPEIYRFLLRYPRGNDSKRVGIEGLLKKSVVAEPLPFCRYLLIFSSPSVTTTIDCGLGDMPSEPKTRDHKPYLNQQPPEIGECQLGKRFVGSIHTSAQKNSERRYYSDFHSCLHCSLTRLTTSAAEQRSPSNGFLVSGPNGQRDRGRQCRRAHRTERAMVVTGCTPTQHSDRSENSYFHSDRLPKLPGLVIGRVFFGVSQFYRVIPSTPAIAVPCCAAAGAFHE